MNKTMQEDQPVGFGAIRWLGRALVAVLLLTAPLLAQAQVAAPSILPGSMHVVDPEGWINPIFPYGENLIGKTDGTLTPDNPAAMQWAAKSEIAYGTFDSSTSHRDTPALTDYDYDYSGTYQGARWVTSYFAIGGEVIEWEGKNTAMGDFENKNNNWAVSVNLFDTLSLGAAKKVENQDFVFNISPTTIFIGRETNSRGVTLRLAEIFHLGYVQGTEKLRLLNKTTAFEEKGERDMSQFGIGLSARGEGVSWHVEYSQGTKDDVALGTTEYFAKEEETMIVAEAVFGQLAAGVTLRTITTSRPVNTSSFPQEFNGEMDVTRFSVGWVSPFGLTLNYMVESVESTGSTPGQDFTRTIDNSMLSASFQF